MKQKSLHFKESDLQSQILKWLKPKREIYTLDLSKTGAWSGKGKPDLVLCFKGQFVALELKVGNNQMQADQVIHMKKIIRAGGKHYTPRTFDEFIKIMEEIGYEKRNI